METRAWFPRIFSGVHARCDDLSVRKDCTRHLLVEDLGYFQGRVGGTPDHDELYRRIGDDLGHAREEWDRLEIVPEMQHYGVKPEWGGLNYTVHEQIEQEEASSTHEAVLAHLPTAEDRRAAEAAMREMHRLLEAYADGLARRHLPR
jgi:pyrroloquinoline quinone (PQQ) biosynthesis protein C